MLKHIIALILLSILVILGVAYLKPCLDALLAGHQWVDETLKQVFSGGKPGEITRQLLALLSIPLLIGLVPALIFWLARRKWFPFFMELVWVLWLIEVSALVMLLTSGSSKIIIPNASPSLPATRTKLPLT